MIIKIMENVIGQNTPIQWAQRQVLVADLVPFEANPRRITAEDFKHLKNSLEQDGYHQRILATQDLRVIGGHQRIKALKQLGYESIEVLVPDREISDEQFKRILVRDNLAYGQWELESLGELLPFAELAEIGLTDADLGKLERTSVDGLTDEDDLPETPVKPVSASGDVWLLGEHRVMCGDSTKPQDMAELMAGELAAMLLTDPPYNVAIQGGNRGDPERTNGLKIKNNSMANIDFRQFLVDAMRTADQVMKPGAVFYVWHADSEGYNFRGACQDVGWKVRQCIIWLKNTIVMGRQDYHWKHEPCLYGWKDGAAHLWTSDRKQSTIIECNKPQRNGEHPTMKPVELMEYQIGNNTHEGDIVLDSFGGSGSTLIACEKTKRAARLLELDPIYVDVIVNRWQAFTGQQARLQATGETFAERSSA